MRSVSIIGVGRLGGALAIGLSREGFPLSTLVTRGGRDLEFLRRSVRGRFDVVDFNDFREAAADVLVISVQDSLIGGVAARLASTITAPVTVLHTSGSLSSDVLDPLRRIGCSVGSMHPLVSFSDAESGAELFRGGFFCIEGDPEAVDAASHFVSALGGIRLTIPSDRKALYHAAAVTACGHVVSLLDVAFSMMAECGLSRDEAREALMPLVQSTVVNLIEKKPEEALTGPFARADAETVTRNLEAVRISGVDGAEEVFAILGGRSLDLAERAGIDPEDAARIRRLLRLAVERCRMLDS
jgi:predicted short-subunit dehydrogenase-like oxidoreductase (DUF2520 family)